MITQMDLAAETFEKIEISKFQTLNFPSIPVCDKEEYIYTLNNWVEELYFPNRTLCNAINSTQLADKCNM